MLNQFRYIVSPYDVRLILETKANRLNKFSRRCNAIKRRVTQESCAHLLDNGIKCLTHTLPAARPS